VLFAFSLTGHCFVDIGTIGPIEETKVSVENSFQGKSVALFMLIFNFKSVCISYLLHDRS